MRNILATILFSILTSSFSFADEQHNLIEFKCQSDIDQFSLKPITIVNLDEKSQQGDGRKALEDDLGLYQGESINFRCEMSFGVILAKINFQPVHGGMCGGNPPAHLDLWISDELKIDQVTIHDSCYPRTVQSIQIDKDNIKLCAGESLATSNCITVNLAEKSTMGRGTIWRLVKG